MKFHNYYSKSPVLRENASFFSRMREVDRAGTRIREETSRRDNSVKRDRSQWRSHTVGTEKKKAHVIYQAVTLMTRISCRSSKPSVRVLPTMSASWYIVLVGRRLNHPREKREEGRGSVQERRELY